MSYHKHRDSPPLWWAGDVIDQLIYQALLAEVREAEPSPHVWENIWECVAAARTTPPDRRSTVWVRSFLNNVLAFWGTLLFDRSWEARLAKRRPLFLWSDYILIVV
jgi:hypothetical protein